MRSGFWRFFAYLNLFVFAMLILSWRIISSFSFSAGRRRLCSYLLIGSGTIGSSRRARQGTLRRRRYRQSYRRFRISYRMFLIYRTFDRSNLARFRAGGAVEVGSHVIVAITWRCFSAPQEIRADPALCLAPDAMAAPRRERTDPRCDDGDRRCYMVARCSLLYALRGVALRCGYRGHVPLCLPPQLDSCRMTSRRSSHTPHQPVVYFLALVWVLSARIFHVMTACFFKALLFLEPDP